MNKKLNFRNKWKVSITKNISLSIVNYVCLHTFHKSMAQARWMHRMVQYKNYLYVVGGVGSKTETPLKSCERFNLITKEWEPMADMVHARHSMGICAHEWDQKLNTGPKLLVFGGVGDKKSLLTDVEEYDIETDTWRLVYLKNYGQAPKSAGIFAVSVNAQQIAIFGGFRHIAYEKGTSKVPPFHQPTFPKKKRTQRFSTTTPTTTPEFGYTMLKKRQSS